MFTTLISYLAAIFTTIAFIPQARKVMKHKDTSGLSLGMYVLYVLGVGCWLLYGILTKNIPILASNAVCFVLACIILAHKLKETKK